MRGRSSRCGRRNRGARGRLAVRVSRGAPSPRLVRPSRTRASRARLKKKRGEGKSCETLDSDGCCDTYTLEASCVA